jgi:hypothetical protein
MPARLGHHSARNEGRVAAGAKGTLLSVQKNIRETIREQE